jgi:small-conductance mechanosensitive channel
VTGPPLVTPLEADALGSGWGALIALLLIAVLLVAAVWVDQRVAVFVRRFAGARLLPLRLVARRPLLARAALWLAAAAVSLALALWLSALVAWILVPAGVVALALAFTPPLRDVVLGVGGALSGRLKEGDYVAIAELEGEITRVGMRAIELRTLDGTRVDVSHGRIAREGLRRLTAEGGGYPVDMALPVHEDLDLATLVEAARLAACLAPHAHLGARPAVSLSETVPPVLQVRGFAIDPFSAGPYRGEVVMSFRETVAELRADAAEQSPADAT